jgi:DNA-directed RNA polymerase specialized sigma24 family protein
LTTGLGLVVVAMREVEKLTYRQMATRLGISAPGARDKYLRARRRLDATSRRTFTTSF